MSRRREAGLSFTCPRCMSSLRAAPHLAGTRQRCPRCQLVVEVPRESQPPPSGESYPMREGYEPLSADLSAYVAVVCPLCHTRMYAAVDQVGEKLTCPDCGASAVVSPPPVVAPPKPPPAPSEAECYGIRAEWHPPSDDEPSTEEHLLRLNCSTCGTMLYATETQIGTRIPCPDCRRTTVVPRPPDDQPKQMPRTAEEIGEYALAKDAAPSPEEADLANRGLVPVVCLLCGTRMYAKLAQVGHKVTCPDCGTRALVAPPPSRPREIDAMAGAGEGYDLAKAPPAPRPAPVAPSVASRTAARSLPERQLPEIDRRPILPSWPFLVGTFTFPFSAGARVTTFWFVILTTFVTCIAPIVVIPLLGAVAFVLVVLWFVFASACALVIVRDTAEGCDRVEEWPGLAFIDWMGSLFYILNSWILSALPGFAVAWWTEGHGSSQLGGSLVLAGIVLLFPFLLLSMLENNSSLGVVSLPVCQTLGRCPKAWATFYLLSAALCVAVDAVFRLAIRFEDFLGAVLLVGPLLAIVWFIYFRLLGRLAWVCADRMARAVGDGKARSDKSVKTPPLSPP